MTFKTNEIAPDATVTINRTMSWEEATWMALWILSEDEQMKKRDGEKK